MDRKVHTHHDTILLRRVQSVTRGRPPTFLLRPDPNQAADLDLDCIVITDSEQGLILGPAFTVPFLIGGLPISAAADHYRLTTVLAIGCALWSCVVVALSWSSSLAELVVWRFVFSISPTLAHRKQCTHVLFSAVGSASEIAKVIVACSSPPTAFARCPCCKRN
jgi:MFS family permease